MCEVAGRNLARGRFDFPQGKQGTANQGVAQECSDEDDDNTGDREVGARGAQGALNVCQRKSDRHGAQGRGCRGGRIERESDRAPVGAQLS
ncbi:Uncharacterised protein [Chlamydia trachomatis]|nr:Uncharacterised protein [Chlamydia trachomatis]